MRHPLLVPLVLAVSLAASPAHSFCGFYVASGTAKLFNHASRVALVRDGDRTVITMSNDFKGDPTRFAMVVPVPTVLEKNQIHVGDAALLDHLDAYSAPRLVEYWDPDPCPSQTQHILAEKGIAFRGGRSETMAMALDEAVQVVARYTVDEYDIVILSADESTALERWLHRNGYNVPAGAARALGAYVKQGMKFFVARVNLKEQHRLGFSYLRPLQIAYESPKFMLPIRLGMVNAEGSQELFVYAITRSGRVETVNYRTLKLPGDREVPDYVKTLFPEFYRSTFTHAVESNGGQVVFTEYAWDMSNCDPCASAPLSPDELRRLGVFWIDPATGGTGSAFVTRLHVRYDRAHFPEDLVFQVTTDREQYQGRYILRHFWNGDADCDAAKAYRAGLAARRAQQARALVELTGWPADSVRSHMGTLADWSTAEDHMHWWDRLWK